MVSSGGGPEVFAIEARVGEGTGGEAALPARGGRQQRDRRARRARLDRGWASVPANEGALPDFTISSRAVAARFIAVGWREAGGSSTRHPGYLNALRRGPKSGRRIGPAHEARPSSGSKVLYGIPFRTAEALAPPSAFAINRFIAIIVEGRPPEAHGAKHSIERVLSGAAVVAIAGRLRLKLLRDKRFTPALEGGGMVIFYGALGPLISRTVRKPR